MREWSELYSVAALGLAAGRDEIRNTKTLKGKYHWIELQKIYTSEQFMYTQYIPRCVSFTAQHIYTTFQTDFSYVQVDRDSSVGIVTRYGMDGPGIESR